jgi:hypothetical protein
MLKPIAEVTPELRSSIEASQFPLNPSSQAFFINNRRGSSRALSLAPKLWSPTSPPSQPIPPSPSARRARSGEGSPTSGRRR